MAGAGDVNGDGYADVIVGAQGYDAGQTDEGAAFVFLGNSEGRPVLTRQRRPGTVAPVQPWGLSWSGTSFDVLLTASHPDGTGLVRTEVEACPSGVAFGNLSCTSSLSPEWGLVFGGTSETTDTHWVSGLSANTLYHWRARVLHAPSAATMPGITAPPNPAHGPWRRLNAQATEADIRTDVDSDGDGLLGGREGQLGTNPHDFDTDDDGLGDGAEVNTHGTNPIVADSDGDGLLDGFEVGHGFNPLAAGEQTQDPDSDGLTNLAEQTAGTDPHDADTDDDGLRDDFEVAQSFNPLVSGEQTQDPDADGLSNLGEQTAGSNPHDSDSDDDGLRDGFEVANGFNPLAPGEASQDPDRDGLSNLAEQGAGTDPKAADSDHDGLLDPFELANSFDPLDADENSNNIVDGQDDADADGLGNAAEYAAATNPHDSDSDNDGLLDGLELATGTFGPERLISTQTYDDYGSVFGTDVDGDGDPDVLTTFAFENKIAWYENTDGAGTFGPQQVISTSAYFALSVFAADLDGDGDTDVLSASANDNKIAWYENSDGSGNFGSQKIISTLANNPESVFAADVDGDGDIDVLSASFDDDKIAWYENLDGAGNFGPQHVISTDGGRRWVCLRNGRGR